MHIISVFACLYYLAKERNMMKNAKWAVLVLILFACGSINISINMKFNEMAWIDYRAFPGGPLMFLLQEQAITVNTVGSSFSIIVGFLTDSLLVSVSYLCLVCQTELYYNFLLDLSSSCRLSDVVCNRHSHSNVAVHVQ